MDSFSDIPPPQPGSFSFYRDTSVIRSHAELWDTASSSAERADEDQPSSFENDTGPLDRFLFKQAKKEVFKIMKKEYFPRFKLTPEYEQLLAEAQRRENIQSRLYVWDMITPVEASI